MLLIVLVSLKVPYNLLRTNGGRALHYILFLLRLTKLKIIQKLKLIINAEDIYF